MASCASGAGLTPEASALEEAADGGVAADAADLNGEKGVMTALKSLHPSLESKIGDMKARAKALKVEKKRVAKELGENMTDEELQEMIDEADRDGDGEVNEEEFFRIMKKTSLF